MSSGARVVLVLALALLATDAPLAAAQAGTLAGRLDLSSPSLLSGATLQARLGAAGEAFSQLRERSTGRDLLGPFAIDGFGAPAPEGLGSPRVTLSDKAALITLHDDARVPLLAELRAPGRLQLAPGIHAAQAGALIELSSEQGAALGALSGRVALADGGVLVNPGPLALVLRLPGESSDANARVVAEAFASGALVASAASDDGFLALAGDDAAATQLAGSGASTTLPAGHRTAILAYDLPAADLACLVDGRAVASVASAADVLAAARDGRDAWSIALSGGRAFALVSAITGQRVDLLPRQGSGDGFRGEDGGRIRGQFVAGVLAPGALRVDGFDVLASRAEVFRSIQLGDGDAHLAPADDARRFTLEGSDGAITLVDEPDASLLLRADDRAQAVLTLAAGVQAKALSPRVVALASTQGPAGMLILQQDGALVVEDGAVRSMLAPGERILYRAPAESFPSEPLLAASIAGGRVAAHVALDASLATIIVPYSSSASLGVPDAQRGSVRVLASGAIVLDASRAALPARSARDVDVAVDGAPAEQARSAADALAPGAGARYWTEIGANGSLRVLVATGREGTSDITIHAPGAQLGFRVFPDGAMLGRHTRLVADAAGLTNLSIDGRALLADATAGKTAFGAPRDGALQSDDAVWRVSDGGAVRLVANRSLDATLTLADGVVATSEGPNMLDLGGASLVLVGEGALRAEGRDVRATLAAGAQLVLRVRSAIESEMEDAALLDRALAAGRLAHEIRVEGGEAESIPLTGDVQALATTSPHRIDITLESAQHEGRVVLLTLAPGEMPALERGDAEILVDGKSAHEATSLADALDADQAEYLVLAGDAGSVVVLAVPHFSVHTVTLQERAAGGSTPLLVYATIFLGGLIAAETAILSFRRRKLTFIVSEQEK